MAPEQRSLRTVIEEALAQDRTKSSWNDRFEHWERPASDTEEAQIERAADAVRKALARRQWLNSQGVEVRPQGSYHNNTNVRLESDMDLCVRHPDISVDLYENVDYQAAKARFQYFDKPYTFPKLFADMRLEIDAALRNIGVVTPGTKAFRVAKVPGSRADVDVVPAVKLDFVWRNNAGGIERDVGIAILSTDGKWTHNFPDNHYTNGLAKRAATKHRFKKVVRTFKTLRDELVQLNMLQKKQVPSFLIESLVYRVESDEFLHEEDRYDRAIRILTRSWNQLGDPKWTASAKEINDLKLLYHPSQPWTVDDAKAFVRGAWQRLKA